MPTDPDTWKVNLLKHKFFKHIGKCNSVGLLTTDLKTQRETQSNKILPCNLKATCKHLNQPKTHISHHTVAVTLSRNAYFFPSFAMFCFPDLCIKVLRENCKTPGANKIVKWIMGCFHALERQYLQIICIGVYTNPDNPNCIIESYQFNFRYTEQGPEMDILRNNTMQMQVTLEDVKRASVLLIRKLFLLMQNLDPLPNNVYLTMKLFYYDDITPADYQPPGFKEGVCENLWFEGMPVHFRVGEVHTDFHSLRVRVSVEQGQMNKLQEGCPIRRPELASPETQQIEDPPKNPAAEDSLPSEDESAQFKKPTRQLAKFSKTIKGSDATNVDINIRQSPMMARDTS
uniref:Zebrafish testis-expressed 38 n=1 Tax=Nothobranchius furzeri TaxID=105023 RepID=A0A8C6LGI6_NOTFU